MNHYLKYIKLADIREEKLTHISSNHAAFNKVKSGDEIWVCSLSDEGEKLFLVGHMLVDWAGDTHGAETQPGAMPETLKNGDRHALALPETASITKMVDISDIAPYIRFESDSGANWLDAIDGIDPQQLLVLRVLAPSAIGLLRDRW